MRAVKWLQAESVMIIVPVL